MSIQDECNCSVTCPGSLRCACVYSYDDDTCTCHCNALTVMSARGKKISASSMIDIRVKNFNLSMLAQFLDQLCDVELLIPAARAKTKISLDQKAVSLASVIDAVGLRIGQES